MRDICVSETLPKPHSSGNLAVTNQKEETGIIYFNNGQASYAKIVKKPLLKNEEAIYHMLFWIEKPEDPLTPILSSNFMDEFN